MFVFGFAVLFYAAAVEPYMLKITKYTLKNEILSGTKIIFATDFHVAPYAWEKRRLQRIVSKINAQNPDLVILGGDFVKGHKKSTSLSPQEIAAALAQIKAPKAAVLGNHDTYYGKSDVLNALVKVGIPVLDNQNMRININNHNIMLAGVSDYYTDKPEVEKALKNTKFPVIFVTHSPDVFPQLREQVTLAFAGHTHGGQIIFPLIGALLVPSDYGQRYRYGLIYEKNAPLIISSGLGTSLISLRFNNRPEIVLVQFE